MPDNNNHIVEVLCAMWFEPSENEWDSTYFGKYHDKIIQEGFTQKQEQKQFELKFQIDPQTSENTKAVSEATQARMAFKNPAAASAITLSPHFISFHKLAPYTNWTDLMTNIVAPNLIHYQELGLGKGLKEIQCLYLNKYQLPKGGRISDIFNFVPLIEEGTETNLSFQAKYKMSDNSFIQLKLRGQATISENINFYFECSSFVKSSAGSDYHALSMKAHDQANRVYNKIITKNAN